jgi:hypothetical protein
MAAPTPTIHLKGAGMTIEVTGDKVSLQINGAFTSEETRSLIQQIAQARAQIADDPQALTGHAADIQVVGGVAWWTEFKPAFGMSMVAYRHPGLGWIGVLLPPAEVAQLASYLALQLGVAAAAKPAQSAGTNSNDPRTGSGGMLLH